MKMKFLSLLLIIKSTLGFSGELLFENDYYKLTCSKFNGYCDAVEIDGYKGKSYMNKNCSSGLYFNNSKSYSEVNVPKVRFNFFQPEKNDFISPRYLRINYDEIADILVDNEKNKTTEVVSYHCGLLDLETGSVIYSAIARDSFCYEKDFMSYVDQSPLFPFESKEIYDDLHVKFPLMNQDYTAYDIQVLLCNDPVKLKNIDYYKEIALKLYKLGLKYESENIRASVSIIDNYKTIAQKSYLYSEIHKKTKMYLIEGDKISILDEKKDQEGRKWYFINYKGKKELNMWIKSEAVDAK